jgi:O-antigen/teichoic acid export membrane protein
MRSRILRRRAATAFGVYGSAALGFLATVVAARELPKEDFARFALVFGTTTLLQLFVDLTVDEVVIKYGNRYAATGQWGRLRRLVRVGLAARTGRCYSQLGRRGENSEVPRQVRAGRRHYRH